MAFIAITVVRIIFFLSTDCPANNICNLAGQNIKFTGKIVSIRSIRLERTIIEISVQEPQKGIVQVTLPHTQHNLFYGDRVTLSGKLKLPRADSQENFSYPLYLAGKGIYGTMYSPDILGIQTDERGFLYSNILIFREKVRETINKFLAEPTAAVVNAMLIGDQGMISNDLRLKFSKTGIIHILSISGAHVTLVILILVYLGSLVTTKRWVIFLIVTKGVVFYLLLSGAPICAVRAGIMGILAYLAIKKGRLANIKVLFWLSGALLVFINPLVIISDIGYELSYLAVFGMIYLFPPLDKLFCWGKEGLSWKIFKIILLSLSITVSVSPLVMYYFGIYSLVSPITNLILLPFFSVILPLSLVVTVMGLLANYIECMHFFGEILAYFVQLMFFLVQEVVNLLLKIPGSYFSGNIKAGWLALFYILLVISALGLKYWIKKIVIPRRLNYFSRLEFLEPHTNPAFLQKELKVAKKTINKIFNQITASNLNRNFFVCWLLIISCLLLFSVNYLYSSSRPARLVMLDVGQGDSLLLDWPCYHLQILIDGGPGRKVLPELGSILPFYDRKIELLVLTHPHQDHLEGLITIQERYIVHEVLLPSLPQISSPELYKILWNDATRNTIPISILKRGQKIALKEGNVEITELELLTPFFDYGSSKIFDLNDQSVALKMNYPRKILFMGDNSQKTEKLLFTKESHNLQAEILKIGHHGSRFSTSNEFLNTIKPQTALISVGENNFYGHPAKETIRKLKDKNINFFRTDVDSRVEIIL